LVRSTDAQAAQQRHQLEGLGGGHQLAAVAQHVLLEDQAFDDRRARGRRAQALLGHRRAQLVVVDQLACAFHRRQQRGFGVARRRLGLQRHHVDAFGAHDLARATGTRLASSSCASLPYTASQPGLTSTLPLVWNLCSLPSTLTW
jgi:hypothetical protein